MKKTPLYDAVQRYSRGGSESVEILVSSTYEGAVEKELAVVFTPRVLQQFQRCGRVAKKVETVLRYGYIGASSSGRNGIVDVRPSDTRFLNTLETHLDSQEGKDFLEREHTQRNRLKPVKIVAHIPQGVRPIGFFDRETKRVYIVGLEEY